MTFEKAQKSILSIILNHGEKAYQEAAQVISSEHFINDKYRIIWDAMTYMVDNNYTINNVTIVKHLEVQKDKNDVSMSTYLGDKNPYDILLDIQAFDTKSGIKDIHTFAKLMIDEFGVYKNKEMATKIQRAKTVGQQLSIIEEYSKYWYINDSDKPKTAAEIGIDILKTCNTQSGINIRTIKTRLPVLSEYLRLSPANQTIIAGDTGQGKSSLAIQLAADIANQLVPDVDKDTGRIILNDNFEEVTRHRVVLFLSLEMTKEEIFSQFACWRHNMSYNEFDDLHPDIKKNMLEDTTEWVKKTMPNLTIISGCMSLHDIQKYCSLVSAMNGGHIDLVIVDHIGLLEEIETATSMGRENTAYKYCSRWLKMKIATKMKTHTILLSQLNKAIPDARGKINHKPNSDRLYSSSGLKQDASNIIFVYREFNVDKFSTDIKDKNGNAIAIIKTSHISKIIITKSRFGSILSERTIGFIPYLKRFVPIKFIMETNLCNEPNTDIRLTEEQHQQIMQFY